MPCGMCHNLKDYSKHENTNHQESQTIDFRLLFFLASTAKVMSTVETGTLLFRTLKPTPDGTKLYDIAIWHSQDMALINVKSIIYFIIHYSYRIDHLLKQST